MMKRYGSALTGSRRKENQKPSKQVSVVKTPMYHSRKKTLKRKGSMDELTIERLSNPKGYLKREAVAENKLESRRVVSRSRSVDQ